MKKFIEEFRAFIAKGNVIDMAVAVVVGGVPSWSMAKRGLTQILEELKNEEAEKSE